MVCTMNPDPTFSIDMQDHPCAKKIPLESNVEDDASDYASLVNCVMRHTKCGSYCLRKSKTTRKMVCRFKFPVDIAHDSKLVEEPPNSNMYRFIGRRNDPLINSHHRAVLQTWRANIDWSAVTTTESVTHYIAKYSAKSEPASKNFLDTLCGMIDDQRRPCRYSTSAIKRLLIKNASERDISAQEVCHLFMGWHLTESSRRIVVLNLSETHLFSSQLRRRRDGDDREHQGIDPSFFGRYLERPDELQNTSLIEMAKKHYYICRRRCTYNVEAVVRILPELVGKIMPNTDQWESFCRQQVLLNSCYRNVEEAKGSFQMWSEYYAELSRAIENQPTDLGMIEDEFEVESDLEDEQLEDWMISAAMAPNFGPSSDTELGLRTYDIRHEWSEGLQQYPSIDDERRFTHTLGQKAQEEHSNTGPNISLTILSNQQLGALDLVMHAMRERSTIHLIICGGAGTGKSTLINAIVSSTRELIGNDKAVRIMVPTGVGAFNIGGATIHHELSITADRNQSYKKLETERCGECRRISKIQN
ncbi:hypothetical protein MKX01_021719 [Papaver californicum]|nr:hypothetical protein MKX01_021719 [Papaver californicum]